MPESLSIDGHGPLVVHRPATVTEACDLVATQAAKGEAIYPVGGRTQLDYGLVPSKPGIVLDTTALNRVIDYPAKDMTITVEAGMTLVALQNVLGTEGQWLPLDVPAPDKQTLGGLVATDIAGPRRLGYGTLRDFVIGIRFINDRGEEIQGGGRVVKNVAGYDLMKLHTGALGAFGVITQLTLKVRPKPEKKAIVTFAVDGATLAHVLDAMHRSASRPVALHMTGANVIQAVFEEKAVTVATQVQALTTELNSLGLSAKAMGTESNDTIDEMVWGMSIGDIDPKHGFIVQASVKPSQVAEYVTRLPSDVATRSEVLNGIVMVLAAEPLPLPKIGTAVVLRAPTAWKTPERVFGPPTPAWTLMTHIKRNLDPGNVFNPGRMFVT